MTRGQLSDATSPTVPDARVALRLRPTALAVGAGMVAYVVLEPADDGAGDEIVPMLAGQTRSLANVRGAPRGRDDASSVVALRPGARLLRVVERSAAEVSLPRDADTLVLVHGANDPVFALSNDDPSSLRQLVQSAWREANADVRAAVTGSVGGDASTISSRLSQAIAHGDSFASAFVACASGAVCRAWLYSPPAMITLPAASERIASRAALTPRGAIALRVVEASPTALALEATDLFERRFSARRLGPLASGPATADERPALARARDFAIAGAARGAIVGWVAPSGSSSEVRVSLWDPATRQWRTKPALDQRATAVVAVGSVLRPTVVWSDDARRGAATFDRGRWSSVENMREAGEAARDVVVVDRDGSNESPVLFALTSQADFSALLRFDGAWTEVPLVVP